MEFTIGVSKKFFKLSQNEKLKKKTMYVEKTQII